MQKSDSKKGGNRQQPDSMNGIIIQGTFDNRYPFYIKE